jgi:hypothetical protein
VQENDIALIREFNHRFRKISEESGYAFVYETLALIREFIPCREIGTVILKVSGDTPENMRIGDSVLWLATPLMGLTQDMFWKMYPYIPYAKATAVNLARKVLAGEPIEVMGFVDHEQHGRGVIHKFYEKMVKVSDVVSTAGVIGRHQFLASPFTENHYTLVFCLARDGGQTFSRREKHLIALFYELFLETFRGKISHPNNGPYLPYVTREKFSPRELATIKTCFDLAHSREEITRAAVATRLHLRDTPNPERGILKKAIDKVDYDVGKIRKTVLADFEKDAPENYGKLYRELGLEHFPELFRAYAYFGFYPPGTGGSGQFISYLSGRLEKFR